MTTHRYRDNFQQGWLDVIKRHGVTACIAVFLVWQTTGSFTRQVEGMSVRLEAHAGESDRKLQALIDLVATVVKGQEADRAIARQQVKLLQLNCLYVAHNDDQRRECVR